MALLSVFRENLTNFLAKPKRMGHDLIVEAQYHRPPTSKAKKYVEQLFVLIAEQSGSYFQKFYNYYCFCGC